MSKIVVAKLVRLGMDGDSFKKEMIAKELRTNCKIDDDFIKEYNVNWQTSGHLYIIDEKATKERDSKFIKEVKPDSDKSKEIRDALKLEADGMGLEYAKNIKTDALAKLISDNK